MTGMEPFLEPAASGLTSIVFDIVKKAGGSLLQVIGDKRTIAKASSQYAQKYKNRYGSLKLLGMQHAVPLESVYTAVRFLNELSIRQFESLEALEQAYRDSQKRRFQTRKSRNWDGITVANENQYLMVLGGPGAGKSTFLRKIGLEALKGKKEPGFKHECIPVFLELKQFNTDEIDLRKSIAQEFQHFGFPPSEEFATKALEQGRLLVLLDGLDEVPKKHLNAAMEAIQNFVSRYDNNRFIASCRIAAYRSSFQGFTDIELADFDDAQIQQFIHNWFQSELDRKSGTAEKCWEILNEPGNAAAKELAQTPLLLTFLCLVYNRSQSFPDKRATLYRKALDILLEEWAAEKRILPGEIYQGLNTDLEKILLSEIAYHGFVGEQLFFSQQELVDRIKGFLADTVDKPKYLDGKAVLEAIAAQQGILVERAEDIFSFSHLTLQEYLIAQYISQDSHQIKKLVVEYLTEQRWREVFLLVAGLMRTGDALLELMETELQKYINTPKLQALLCWAERATAQADGDFKPATRRAAALSFACALSRDRYGNLLFDRYLQSTLKLLRSLDGNLKRVLQLAFTNPLNFDCARKFEEAKIFNNSDFTVFLARLEALQARTPNLCQPLQVRQEFVRRVYETWLNAVHLRQEWVDLSEEEAEALVNYLYANELMVRCKEAAVRVSREKWEAIEGRMLLVLPRD